jgi:hypothetical protein
MATTVNLVWPASPADEGVIKYQVLQSLNGGGFIQVGEVSDPVFSIVNPAPGSYRWKARAVNFVGTGPESNIAEGPDLPTKLGDIAVTIVNA